MTFLQFAPGEFLKFDNEFRPNLKRSKKSVYKVRRLKEFATWKEIKGIPPFRRQICPEWQVLLHFRLYRQFVPLGVLLDGTSPMKTIGHGRSILQGLAFVENGSGGSIGFFWKHDLGMLQISVKTDTPGLT